MNADQEKAEQVKKIAAVLAGIMPPAARVALGWAEKLHEHGIRIHPELAETQPTQTPAQKEFTPEVREHLMQQAMATLREMAKQYPYLQPLVIQIENAKTDEERNALVLELRSQIPDELIAQATAQAAELGDNTQ